jgi:hypothetical protein
MFGDISFIIHSALVSHAGEGAVNVFDHYTGIKSVFHRVINFLYAIMIDTVAGCVYN